MLALAASERASSPLATSYQLPGRSVCSAIVDKKSHFITHWDHDWKQYRCQQSRFMHRTALLPKNWSAYYLSQSLLGSFHR